jgi:hypothetical protein
VFCNAALQNIVVSVASNLDALLDEGNPDPAAILINVGGGRGLAMVERALNEFEDSTQVAVVAPLRQQNIEGVRYFGVPFTIFACLVFLREALQENVSV